MAKKLSSDLSKTWNELPAYVRLAIYGIGGFYIYTKLSAWGKGLGDKAARNRAIAEAEAKGQKPSKGEYDYVTYAKQLYNAFSWYSDDEDAAYSVFRKLENDIDFIKLDEAFYDISKEDMIPYVNSYLSNSEQGKINDILAKRGIQYRL